MVTTVLLVAYAAGVLIGVVAIDDRATRRVLLALLWPLGPAAFVIVITGLALVALVLWPLRLIPAAAALAGIIYWFA